MVGQNSVAGLFHVLRWKLMHADVEKAANGALLTLIGKWSAVSAIPLLITLFSALWVKMDRTAESTARLEEKVSSMIERQLPTMQSGFNSRFDAQADRITAHDYRLNRLEDWRNSRSNP